VLQVISTAEMADSARSSARGAFTDHQGPSGGDSASRGPRRGSAFTEPVVPAKRKADCTGKALPTLPKNIRGTWMAAQEVSREGPRQRREVVEHKGAKGWLASGHAQEQVLKERHLSAFNYRVRDRSLEERAAGKEPLGMMHLFLSVECFVTKAGQSVQLSVSADIDGPRSHGPPLAAPSPEQPTQRMPPGGTARCR
jgi:hypothetical protein